MVFTEKQEMRGNRICFMLKLICLTEVIRVHGDPVVHTENFGYLKSIVEP